MKLRMAKDAAEKMRRLERLHGMFDQLSAAGGDYRSFALAGHEQPAPVRRYRLLRVVSEEIEEVTKELQALGVQDLRARQLA